MTKALACLCLCKQKQLTNVLRRGGAVEGASCSSHVMVELRRAAGALTYLDLQRRRFVVEGDRLSLGVGLGPGGGGCRRVLQGDKDAKW